MIMPERREFIAIFKAESEDCLTKLDKGLVELEKFPDNPELVKELNRAAHTLKGSARVMGYIPIQEIAHRIEDIFDQVLQQKLVFTADMADKIFKGIDLIRSALSKVVKEEEIDIDIAQVCAELEGILEIQGEEVHEKQEEKKVSAPHAEPASSQPSILKEDGISQEYIRVPVYRVNKLLNLTGEMVINKMKSSEKVSQIKKLARRVKETQKDLGELNEKIGKALSAQDKEIVNLASRCFAGMDRLREDALSLYDNVSTEVFRLDPVVDELQNKMKEMRMLPCSTIFEGFPRMVRDIAAQERKKVDFEILGGQTELDRKVLERIKTPLMHVLRNCIDHGIEEPQTRKAVGKEEAGKVKIMAFHKAGHVLIEIEDDGCGMDPEGIKQAALKKHLVSPDELKGMSDKEVLNIIFMNGFSTSQLITDVSGRGIGLDVVRRDIESLKGQVLIETQKGKGTKFIFVLPLTIAIINTLLIKTVGMFFAIPLSSVEEALNVPKDQISMIDNHMAIQVRDRLVPLVLMKEVLDLPVFSGEVHQEEDNEHEKVNPVVIISSLDKWVGFIVDEIFGQEEMFLKNLGKHLGKVRNVSGASILGSGDVVVILDPADLIDQSCLAHPAAARRGTLVKKQKGEKKILIAEDTLTIRELEKSILEAQGYQVDVAVDGLDALNKLSATHYDLVVSDIQMPRMDGFELCSTIKKSEEYKDLPIVIVTAMEKNEDKRRGIEVGAQAYIVKSSFDQRNLLDAIERLIGA
jgi:two-component system chemotaxis sensor kinase CheA